jgi:hemolysin activation/secretion protein
MGHVSRLSATALTTCVAAAVACFAPSALAQTTLPSLRDQGQSQMLSAQDSFVLKQLRFTGNTAFKSSQLLDASLDIGVPGAPVDPKAPKVRDLIGKTVTIDQLEQMRVAVTLVYVNAGYINSGAVIDDQSVADGAVVIRIVEGKLTDVQISGNKRLRDRYLRGRIFASARPPLSLQSLRDQLEILRQNPNISQINAELRPGAEPGDAALDVRVQENNPYQVGLIFDNHRSPSVGAERVSFFAETSNLLGFSDTFHVQAALTDGGIKQMRLIGHENGDPPFSDWPEVFVDYTVPVTPNDLTLTFSFQKSDSSVIEAPFQDLGIDSELLSYTVSARQPIYRTPASELALFLSGNVKQNKTFLLGEPFSFSPGAENGVSNATSIRFGQEYFYRDVKQAIALRSTFSVGVDAFNATTGSGADGQYWSWIGQAQYVRRLGSSNIQGVARLNVQLTDQPLLAIEQFSVGGVDTVRGYRENTFVRDNGITGSLELRIPVYSQPARQTEITLIPFFDVGYAWNHSGDPDSDVISSLGVGASIDYTKHLSAQVFWGLPLNDVDDSDNNLQDYGFHFQVVMRLF